MSQSPVQTVGPDAGLCEQARDLADVIESYEHPNIGEASGINPREHRLPTMHLPGFKPKQQDDCGDWVPFHCTDCGDPTPVGSTCYSPVCERCAPAWAKRRTETHVAKLDATAKKMSSDRNEPVYKHHVVFQPPGDWFTERENAIHETKKCIRDLLMLMDAQGIVAYHPWSGEGPGDDLGEWTDRLFNERSWRDVRQELEPRGHFHAIVCSPWIQGGKVTRQLEKATGWVIHRVEKRDGSGKSLEDLHDVARAVSYVLSHTGVEYRDEQNYAHYEQYGTDYKGIDTSYGDTERRTAEAVRDVVPHTLGLPPSEVRCESERADADVTEWDYSTAANDGDGDGGDGGSDRADTVHGTRTCLGELRHVRHAPELLDDDEWREQADPEKVERLEQTYREWEADEWDPPD